MTCEEAQQHIVALIQGELGDEERESVESHLAECESCRQVRDQWAKLIERGEVHGDAPWIKVANALISGAIRDGASDIHLVPAADGGKVQFRIDGLLRDVMPTPQGYDALVARFKVMAECDVAEKRLPQDGRVAIRFEKKDYDLRLSSLPCLHGESVVMRVFPQDQTPLSWDAQGISESHRQQLRALLGTPSGVLIFAGATGTGKTTTMYSAVAELDHEALNVVAVEDPVNYGLPGLVQIHVNRKRGLTSGAWITELLRCDPDVLMVGEVRDRETADPLVEAALTGHLCLTVMHAADAVDALLRFAALCSDPARSLPAVIGVVGQRLARKVCADCGETDAPPDDGLTALGIAPDTDGLRRGAGCEQCRGTGYRGRVGLFEVLEPDDDLRHLVLDGADRARLRDYLIARGWDPIVHDARAKVLEGRTSVAEALRVTGDIV